MRSEDIKIGHIRNGLLRKNSLISKFMMSQPGRQTIAIQILPNISKCKSNQTMKFGQLIKYNMNDIFPENLYTKYGREATTRPFSKN